MNLSGVVILYHPDDTLPQRINSYKQHLKKLYVVDNSEVSNKELLNTLQEDPNIFLIHDGKNEGIAKRLNEAARLAIKDGFDWLLTMDQDSYFDTGLFDEYLNCINRYSGIDQVAMFGIEYDKKLWVEEECAFSQVNHLITSGSLLNLNLFKEIKGFDEALFIDNVDHEYCYHAKQLGFEIVKLSNILLCHSLGVVSYHRSLKNLKSTPRTLHSPVRMYYTIRNYFYLYKKYGETFSVEIKEIKKSILNRIKNNLLYHENRFRVFKYMIKGYLDYKKNKMGKLK